MTTPTRILPDGRKLWLYRMMFTYRLCLGRAGNDLWYEDAWCYETKEAGLKAMNDWTLETLEPTGWHRHPNTGRRRPEGDPAKEYVNP